MSIHTIWNLRSEIRLREKSLSKTLACEYTSLSSFPSLGPFRKRPKPRGPLSKGLKLRGALRDRRIRRLNSTILDCRLNEGMNETLFNLGIDEVG